MAQGQSTPPGQDRPWYYQNWFLIATFIMGWPIAFPFVLWPVWALLMLRSPWHSHTLIKGLAWANIITGGWLVVKNFQSPQGAELAISLIFPGFVVTMITQFMWTKYKLEHRIGRRPPALPATSPTESDSTSQRSGARRRVQRKRRSRSGRSSRGS